MKTFSVLSVFIISCTALHAQYTGLDAWGYPPEEAIVSYVCSRVDPASLRLSERFKMAKKADGWYIYKYDFLTIQSRDFELCWDRATGNYAMGGDGSTKPGDEQLNAFKKYFLEGEAYTCKKEPLYGYVGWTADVIKLLTDSAHLCDANLEALARAYSCDLGYRTGQFGDYISPSLQFKLGDYAGHMTQAQLDTFELYTNLELAVIKRLIKQNPDYTVLVGNIRLKYDDEVMAAFLTLAYSQSMQLGLKELDRGPLFDPVTLSFAENLLNSCDKNSILLCEGDNDTYPLYYAQAKLGIRRDVLLVNTSLIELPIFINFIRAGVFDAPGLPISLDTSSYATGKLVYLKRDDAGYGQFIHVTGISQPVDRDYLYKSDMVIIDMLNTNAWQRPVYYTPTISPDAFLGFDKYIKNHGYVYQLEDTFYPSSSTYDHPFDTAFTFDMIMNHTVAVDWKSQPYFDESSRNLLLDQRVFLIKLALAFSATGDTQKCLALLRKYESLYPLDKIPYDVFAIDLPALYLTVGEKVKAVEVANQFISKGSTLYKATVCRHDIGFKDWNHDMREGLYIWQEMVTFFKSHPELKSKTGDIEKNFNDANLAYNNELKLRNGQ